MVCGRGVQRLRGGRQRPDAWNCIECTRISNAKAKPTPQQVKAEVWMSIIHGSQGLIYFCHQFQPRFIEAGLLADQEMAQAVGAINREVQGLAEVINSPSILKAAMVAARPAEVAPDMARLLAPRGIAMVAKQFRGATYFFAVRMEASPAHGKFQGRACLARPKFACSGRTVPSPSTTAGLRMISDHTRSICIEWKPSNRWRLYDNGHVQCQMGGACRQHVGRSRS